MWGTHDGAEHGEGGDRGRELAGGGVLFHTMVHLLDAVLWALGSPRPLRATASSYKRLDRMPNPPPSWEGSVEACEVEDFNVGLVHFADGSTMTIESNWLMHPQTRQSGAELLGERGVAGGPTSRQQTG